MKYVTIAFLLLSFSLQAQTKMSNEEYVDKYYPIAVRKMVEYKIPASITLAQGILESGSGNSTLAKNANNHFGIKCHTEWTGKGFYMDDDAENECFRVYANPEESFADHSLFLTSRARYKFLFEEYKVNDYKSWAKGLKKAGYATNPKYPDLLIGLIERYELYKYDNFGLSDILEETELTVDNTKEDLQDWKPEPKPINETTTNDVINFNGIEAVKSNGRQLVDIAKKYDVSLSDLLKYNDAEKTYTFSPDQYIYLSSKKNKGSSIKHFVKPGETMWEISQMYAIKLNKLYKRNKMSDGEEARDGEILYLQGKRETKPRTITHQQVLNEKQRLIDEAEAERQAKIEAEKKAKEEAEQKALEELRKKQEEEAARQAKIELQERQRMIQKEMEEKKKAFDEAMRQLELEEAEKLKEQEEKAAAEEVAEEKEYNETNVVKYTVKAGDTLYGISNKYYITVEKIMELNNLTSTNLSIGQILIVSP